MLQRRDIFYHYLFNTIQHKVPSLMSDKNVFTLFNTYSTTISPVKRQSKSIKSINRLNREYKFVKITPCWALDTQKRRGSNADVRMRKRRQRDVTETQRNFLCARPVPVLRVCVYCVSRALVFSFDLEL